jgi:hypothetical protein
VIGGVGGQCGAGGVGGAGASVNITAGAGGASTGNGTGGAGGIITLTAGATGATSGGTAGKTGFIRRIGMLVDRIVGTTATDTATLTVTQLATGYIVATPTAAAAYTLPTGTAMSAAFALADTDSFDVIINNVATNAGYIITMTAADDFTIVGAVVIPSNSSTTGGVWGTSSAKFRMRKTTANTWVCHRL